MKKVKVYDSREGYNLAAHEYDKREAYLGSFEKNQLIPLLGDLKGKKVLDVGAGTGRLSVSFARLGAGVTALDVSETMLQELSKKNRNIKTVIGDAESLPFENEAFDIVAAAFLIVHLKDPTKFFDEAYRVLKDGGIFLVTNINQKDPPKIKAHNHEFVVESFYHRPEKIREILESLAFGIEKEEFIKENDVWINQIILARK
ncbi:MAG: methyltransferase domain-containing protein [Patescibacteria group bacterium]|jgi:ubiquinone/menaquinone biosynthesis C-methylase UbiE